MTQEGPDTAGCLGIRRVFPVATILVEAPIDVGENLVGLVDDAQIEGFTTPQDRRATLASGAFAAHEEDAGSGKLLRIAAHFDRLNLEEPVEFILPLPQQGFRHNEQDAGNRPFGAQLSDHQPGLDGLAEAHLVGQYAASLRDPFEGEDYRVDLMRIGIDTALALRGGEAGLVAGTAQAHEFLGAIPALDRVRDCHLSFGFR